MPRRSYEPRTPVPPSRVRRATLSEAVGVFVGTVITGMAAGGVLVGVVALSAVATVLWYGPDEARSSALVRVLAPDTDPESTATLPPDRKGG